jgi:hypothetical protein
MSVTGSASLTSLQAVALKEAPFTMQKQASLQGMRDDRTGNWSCFQAIGRLLLWATRNSG